jgi:hypothetical protein
VTPLSPRWPASPDICRSTSRCWFATRKLVDGRRLLSRLLDLRNESLRLHGLDIRTETFRGRWSMRSKSVC